MSSSQNHLWVQALTALFNLVYAIGVNASRPKARPALILIVSKAEHVFNALGKSPLNNADSPDHTLFLRRVFDYSFMVVPPFHTGEVPPIRCVSGYA